jgi:short-subunit dehydrogenase
MRLNLLDKSVLVTGASRGIGAALARQFAARGARLALLARDRSELMSLQAELAAGGASAEVVCADLSEDTERARAIAEVQLRLGSIDVLVNNAGRGLYGRVETLTPEQLRAVFELNVVAPAHLSSLVLPSMRDRGSGTLVMVSSVLGARAVPMSGGYCASKFALEALCQSLRAELVGSGVRVLVVRPGRTESSFRDAALTSGFRPKDKMQPMSAAKVAAASVRAVERGVARVNFTSAGKAMMAAERVSPALVDRVMSKLYRKMVEGTDDPR